ncbi:MAG: TolB family protein [Fimbriimonadaceae bacterium]
MVQGNSTANTGLIAGLVGAGLLAIVIGCGGGGGGGLTGTGTTTATTTTGTSTTGTTTTTGTTGAVVGSLPPNVLIYSFIDPNDPTFSNVLVDYISPDGTGNTSYASYNENTTNSQPAYYWAAPNPTPAANKSNAFAFSYMNATTNLWDIYTNSTVSITNAKQITSKGFSAVNTIQFTPDGTKLVFTAISGSGNSQLFVVNIDGTQLRFIDSADDAYIAPDGVNIAYAKPGAMDSSSNPVDEIYTVHLDGTQVRQITGTADNLDHDWPQWSKDSTRLTWSAGPSGAGWDVFAALPDGTQLTQLTTVAGTTAAPGDAAVSPSFNTDGTQVGFVRYSSAADPSKIGVWYVAINGLGMTQIQGIPQSPSQPALLLQTLYWTSSVGTLNGKRRPTTPLFGVSHHVEVLKKLGKWPYK